MRMDLAILDELGCLPFSHAGGAYVSESHVMEMKEAEATRRDMRDAVPCVENGLVIRELVEVLSASVTGPWIWNRLFSSLHVQSRALPP